MCEDKVVIPLALQSYAFNWYHMHILHSGLDRTEAMILKKIVFPELENQSKRKLVLVILSNIQNFQKKGELPSKNAEEIPWNKLFVYLICTYIIHRNIKNKGLHLKAVTMISTITLWFK